MEIWDDEGDELTTSKTHEEREWTRISETFHNDGYREGITTGKESALQQGFDDGFNDIGVPIGKEIGILRGIVTGLLHFVNSPSSGIDGQILPTIKILYRRIH
ncbi:hypothetical protein FRC02_010050 [Tulasnella sp. 418]|nr:hypothetical protein FRC02_010050 [Tulasnella sp. 418]